MLYWDQDTVCKPYSLREYEFYNRVPVQFKEFQPKYCGKVNLAINFLYQFLPTTFFIAGLVEVRFIEDESGYLLLVAKSSTSEDGHSVTTQILSTPDDVNKSSPTKHSKRSFHSSKHRCRFTRKCNSFCFYPSRIIIFQFPLKA